MRNLKFILSAVAILLAGALTAGLAARTVVSPQTGETINAGVLSIPSVLGQTADEVLFYPWSLYDMEELTPVTEDALTYLEGMQYAAAGFDLLGVECDTDQLVKSQMWTNDVPRNGYLTYVKEFYAVLSGGAVPVSLDYAMSTIGTMAVSYLVSPREETELTEEQRQAAMDKVKNDLAWMLCYMLDSSVNYHNDLIALLESFAVRFQEMEPMSFGFQQLEWLFQLLYESYGGILELQEYDSVKSEAAEPQGPPPMSLEELLSMEKGAVDVQFVATPRQVVLLFSGDDLKVGVYYDVQLGQYSGLGISM